MNDPYFFGYGSLVNLATHTYTDPHNARIKGWRRVWRHTSVRDLAFLTVEPSADSEIDGVIAAVPGHDWAALDERESAYDRLAVGRGLSHDAGRQLQVAFYAIPKGKHGPASVRHPIVLSYIDVVVQGYFQRFGLAGVARFFETTSGWNAPILDDRRAPLYPRHQVLNTQETALVDHHLADLSAMIKQRD